MANANAKYLRKNMTDAELLLWQHLRRRQILGLKFRRQHPVGSYIVDFVCLEKKFVIEVDGSQHLINANYDKSRTLFLKSVGFQVVRFWNHDVLNSVDSVLERIVEFLDVPSPRPSPCEGEGE